MNFFMAFLQPRVLRSLTACGGQPEDHGCSGNSLTPLQVPGLGSCCIGPLCSWKSSQILISLIGKHPHPVSIGGCFCVDQEVGFFLEAQEL